MRVFDIALIGAGPAGYAALTALRGFSGSLAVITGATPDPWQGGPAKVVSVAFERQKPACLADRMPVSGDAPPMYAAAEVGGLANYWGKQLQVYGSDDPWGQGPFLETWKAYKTACDTVQADLEVIGGTRQQNLDSDFEASVPRLLVGTKDAPGSQLNAMALAVEKRLQQIPSVEVMSGRVQRIEQEQGVLRLDLGGGTQVRARRVFLAAGVLGTATTLARSIPNVSEIGFRDHAPYTINCFRLDRILGPTHSYANSGNFNALTVTLKNGGRCDLFASVYAVSQAPISLLTTNFGLGPRLRGRRVGRIFDFVQPIRLWTPKTQVQFRHNPTGSQTEATPTLDKEPDSKLRRFLDWLVAHGVRSKLGQTAPGQGFHYHRLTLGADRRAVDDVVKSTFDGQLRVIDASCLKQIGCPPHTLTAMAQAYARVSHDLESPEYQ
ncbi:hypothetical protein [Ruegeria arenilitoris]|uniref:hypothetical protein n=1 Tax=Ruegeria arenilitoris TaxID=1173585 RepID=UPI00147D6F22|nr:hypothetical protein [Ruegeria arenilitoris]